MGKTDSQSRMRTPALLILKLAPSFSKIIPFIQSRLTSKYSHIQLLSIQIPPYQATAQDYVVPGIGS